MIELALRTIAHALGGEVSGNQVLAPGPGHSRGDRSLCIRPTPSMQDGLIVHSFAGDDWRMCREYVAAALGTSSAWREASIGREAPKVARRPNSMKFLWIWRQRVPIAGTPAERYLREVRHYQGEIPATLGFLSASGSHPPAMIAAFGLASEPEPGILAIADADILGVHVTRLTADGTAKAGADNDKIMIGRSLGSPIVLAPPNDGLGLAITEGIEDALSIHAVTGLGAWAAGAAGRLPALSDAVPGFIDCCTVVGHDDEAGTRGADELVRVLRARGLETKPTFLKEGA
jgi:hypothetical protein